MYIPSTLILPIILALTAVTPADADEYENHRHADVSAARCLMGITLIQLKRSPYLPPGTKIRVGNVTVRRWNDEALTAEELKPTELLEESKVGTATLIGEIRKPDGRTVPFKATLGMVVLTAITDLSGLSVSCTAHEIILTRSDDRNHVIRRASW